MPKVTQIAVMKLVPHHIRKPLASDWVTCLYKVCLDPEVKIEKLVNSKKLAKYDLYIGFYK